MDMLVPFCMDVSGHTKGISVEDCASECLVGA